MRNPGSCCASTKKGCTGTVCTSVSGLRMGGADDFLQARDFLLTHRGDYEAAYNGFSWPRLDRFNWALDYFDPMARGETRPALWAADETG